MMAKKRNIYIKIKITSNAATTSKLWIGWKIAEELFPATIINHSS
jgi:hypothetical protein